MSIRSVCRSCGLPILWTITEKGERMPVDAACHPDGNVLIVGNAFGESVGLSRVLGGTALTAAREAGAPLHRSHMFTCVDASGWRRPRKKKARA